MHILIACIVLRESNDGPLSEPITNHPVAGVVDKNLPCWGMRATTSAALRTTRPVLNAVHPSPDLCKATAWCSATADGCGRLVLWH